MFNKIKKRMQRSPKSKQQPPSRNGDDKNNLNVNMDLYNSIILTPDPSSGPSPSSSTGHSRRTSVSSCDSLDGVGTGSVLRQAAERLENDSKYVDKTKFDSYYPNEGYPTSKGFMGEHPLSNNSSNSSTPSSSRNSSNSSTPSSSRNSSNSSTPSSSRNSSNSSTPSSSRNSSNSSTPRLTLEVDDFIMCHTSSGSENSDGEDNFPVPKSSNSTPTPPTLVSVFSYEEMSKEQKEFANSGPGPSSDLRRPLVLPKPVVPAGQSPTSGSGSRIDSMPDLKPPTPPGYSRGSAKRPRRKEDRGPAPTPPSRVPLSPRTSLGIFPKEDPSERRDIAPARGSAPPPIPSRGSAPPPIPSRGSAPPPIPSRGSTPPPNPKNNKKRMVLGCIPLPKCLDKKIKNKYDLPTLTPPPSPKIQRTKF